jgi:hypothetical protein
MFNVDESTISIELISDLLDELSPFSKLHDTAKGRIVINKQIVMSFIVCGLTKLLPPI